VELIDKIHVAFKVIADIDPVYEVAQKQTANNRASRTSSLLSCQMGAQGPGNRSSSPGCLGDIAWCRLTAPDAAFSFMKAFYFSILAFLSIGKALFAAEGPVSTNLAPQSGPGRGGRGVQNSNDVFYTLGPDSKPREGVPKGKFSEAKVIPSNVFPGTQHTYWVYVPAQYDPAQPTAVMVFNDGQAMKAEPGDVQAQNVLDNLIFRREIPVILGVFINPGRRPEQPEPNPRDWGDRTSNRADEYNPPNDKYARVIVEELMPALKKEYNISDDPDLHGIMGSSSGGCAAFAVAWFRPNDFHKVVTFVGSFTSIRGEYIYPELVAESEKKPIRIFMQDGRNDNRRPGNPNGDWFYQNVRLMKALTAKNYEVNYAWGIGNHGQKQGGAIFPEIMRWLWRDQPVSTDPNDIVERSFRQPAQKIPDTPSPEPATVPAKETKAN
jgi:enterochelin esterase family protein